MPRPLPQIDGLIFDLGNVVLDWNALYLYQQLYPVAEAKWITENVCTMDWHNTHDAGVPMADNRAHLIDQHPKYKDAIVAWDERWLDMFDGYVKGMPELLDRLFATELRLFALSNLPHEKWMETANAFPYLYKFEDVVVSGTEKVRKPDPKIYEIAISRSGLPAKNLLFIDDRHENVQAAIACGLNAIRFSDATTLASDLREGYNLSF